MLNLDDSYKVESFIRNGFGRGFTGILHHNGYIFKLRDGKVVSRKESKARRIINYVKDKQRVS